MGQFDRNEGHEYIVSSMVRIFIGFLGIRIYNGLIDTP